MSLEQLSIFLICIAFLVLFSIKKVTKKSKKRWLICLLLSITGLFFVLGTILFIRQHFIPFNTPETAYKQFCGGEVSIVVEGIKSDYVIGNKNEMYLNKSKNGWKIPVINISVTKAIKRIGSTTIYASQYNFSDEYYLTILDSENNTLEINDNRESIFYYLDKTDKYSDTKSCVYYTYVNKINNEYIITVNGEEIKLIE